MIHDRDTNQVYLSRWLKEVHPRFFKSFTSRMDAAGIHWELLKYTNDYWVRDFMPIQLDDNVFVKYRYWPDYLLKNDKLKETITNCSRACKCIGITYRETDIIIDGGNVVPCGDYIVMTDKVFTENHRAKGDVGLLKEIERVFDLEPIIIPWHKEGEDEYGHADGLVKYVGGNKILMSNHRDTQPKEADAIRHELERHGFEVIEFMFDVENPQSDYNWAYINFLQVGKSIIMPTFDIKEDEIAKQQIARLFPNCNIFGVRYRQMAHEGGALHCLTWSIKK